MNAKLAIKSLDKALPGNDGKMQNFILNSDKAS